MKINLKWKKVGFALFIVAVVIIGIMIDRHLRPWEYGLAWR